MNGTFSAVEQTCHRLADAAVAADHHVILQLPRVIHRQVMAVVDALQTPPEPARRRGHTAASPSC